MSGFASPTSRVVVVGGGPHGHLLAALRHAARDAGRRLVYVEQELLDSGRAQLFVALGAGHVEADMVIRDRPLALSAADRVWWLAPMKLAIADASISYLEVERRALTASFVSLCPARFINRWTLAGGIWATDSLTRAAEAAQVTGLQIPKFMRSESPPAPGWHEWTGHSGHTWFHLEGPGPLHLLVASEAASMFARLEPECSRRPAPPALAERAAILCAHWGLEYVELLLSKSAGAWTLLDASLRPRGLNLLARSLMCRELLHLLGTLVRG